MRIDIPVSLCGELEGSSVRWHFFLVMGAPFHSQGLLIPSNQHEQGLGCEHDYTNFLLQTEQLQVVCSPLQLLTKYASNVVELPCSLVICGAQMSHIQLEHVCVM